MIRFINLKNQIIEGENSFAFFDTVSGCLLTFCDEQIFESIEEFENAYSASYPTRPINRFISLIPENYFEPETKQKL